MIDDGLATKYLPGTNVIGHGDVASTVASSFKHTEIVEWTWQQLPAKAMDGLRLVRLKRASRDMCKSYIFKALPRGGPSAEWKSLTAPP